jgi:hypothetical protein
MGKRTFTVYQYLSPAVLTPLSLWLWWRTYDGNPWLVAVAWFTPILYAYAVPGVGTNLLKVWEFDTRFRLGRFRPHHGFVFGSATAIISWICHTGTVTSVAGIFQAGFIYASVLGFWNVLYDVKALQVGILRVYNQPWADGKEPEAVALDYAPWFFAGFGGVYGAGMGFCEWLSSQGRFNGISFAWIFPLIASLSVVVPLIGYRHRSLKLHGHSGCHPVERKA